MKVSDCCETPSYCEDDVEVGRCSHCYEVCHFVDPLEEEEEDDIMKMTTEPGIPDEILFNEEINTDNGSPRKRKDHARETISGT
jgi:hypothetical protein